MDKYAQIRELSKKDHKRLTGVNRETFSEMVLVCGKSQKQGPPSPRTKLPSNSSGLDCKTHRKMDNARQELGPRNEPICHHFRRQTAHRGLT